MHRKRPLASLALCVFSHRKPDLIFHYFGTYTALTFASQLTICFLSNFSQFINQV